MRLEMRQLEQLELGRLEPGPWQSRSSQPELGPGQLRWMARARRGREGRLSRWKMRQPRWDLGLTQRALGQPSGSCRLGSS